MVRAIIMSHSSRRQRGRRATRAPGLLAVLSRRERGSNGRGGGGMGTGERGLTFQHRVTLKTHTAVA